MKKATVTKECMEGMPGECVQIGGDMPPAQYPTLKDRLLDAVAVEVGPHDPLEDEAFSPDSLVTIELPYSLVKEVQKKTTEEKTIRFFKG